MPRFLSKLLLFSSLLFFVGCGTNLLEFATDKESKNACRFKASQDLDKAKYDDVISSSCSDTMQKGAAHFGKAGFDIKSVINTFSDATNASEKPLDLYLGALTGVMTGARLESMDSAKSEYSSILSTDIINFKDANLYVALIDSVKSLSLIKLIVDADGDGILASDCDINSNGIPDEADAVACALVVSVDVTAADPCSIIGASAELKDTLNTFSGKSGIYRATIVSIDGTAAGSCSKTYDKVLIENTLGTPADTSDDIYAVATTTPEVCQGTGDGGRNWPCPIEVSGTALDFVSAISTALESAGSAVDIALGGNPEVKQSLDEIRTEACGGDTCTAAELSTYLNNANNLSVQ